MALVMAFLAAEDENQQLKDLQQANFRRVPERFLFFLVSTNSITENFVYWKLGPIFFFVVIQRTFSSWVSQRTSRFLFGRVSILLFHSLIKSTFLVRCAQREIPYLRAPMYFSLFFIRSNMQNSNSAEEYLWNCHHDTPFTPALAHKRSRKPELCSELCDQIVYVNSP